MPFPRIYEGLTGLPQKEIKILRSVWSSMKDRCLNPSNKDWNSYGGRGIQVSENWMKLSNFIQDMGIRPEGLTLDRIDVDGNYCKNNCRWASRVLQGLNRRPFAAETFTRSNNTSGISGVRLEGKTWRVKAGGNYIFKSRDFFEACCVRKSYEANNQREL